MNVDMELTPGSFNLQLMTGNLILGCFAGLLFAVQHCLTALQLLQY